MLNGTLNRAQRRRLKAAADEADKIIRADDRYFARFPGRLHRVRLASAAEMEANRIANGLSTITTDPGQRWFCAVKQIAPGIRCRAFIMHDADLAREVDGYDEAHARAVYDLAAGTRAQLVEQQLRTALSNRGDA